MGTGPREEENEEPDERPVDGWEWEVPSRDNEMAECLSVVTRQLGGVPVPEADNERAILRKVIEESSDRLQAIVLRISER